MTLIRHVIKTSMESTCYFSSTISSGKNITEGTLCWKVKKTAGVIIADDVYQRNRGPVACRNFFFRILKQLSYFNFYLPLKMNNVHLFIIISKLSH